MIASLRAAARVCLLLVFCSCDPGFELSGRVTDVGGTPISGARVRLGDRRYPWLQAVSDERGFFGDGSIGAHGDDFPLEIEATGFDPMSTRVGDHCFRRLWLVAGGCVDVRLEASLSASKRYGAAP